MKLCLFPIPAVRLADALAPHRLPSIGRPYGSVGGLAGLLPPYPPNPSHPLLADVERCLWFCMYTLYWSSLCDCVRFWPSFAWRLTQGFYLLLLTLSRSFPLSVSPPVGRGVLNGVLGHSPAPPKAPHPDTPLSLITPLRLRNYGVLVGRLFLRWIWYTSHHFRGGNPKYGKSCVRTPKSSHRKTG